MPRRKKKKTAFEMKNTPYLEHPVGSNEWTRQKNIEFEQRRLAKEIAKIKEKEGEPKGEPKQ